MVQVKSTESNTRDPYISKKEENKLKVAAKKANAIPVIAKVTPNNMTLRDAKTGRFISGKKL